MKDYNGPGQPQRNLPFSFLELCDFVKPRGLPPRLTEVGHETDCKCTSWGRNWLFVAFHTIPF